MAKVKTALISVSDKEGIIGFARDLQKMGIKIVSTGGTAKFLRQNKIKVVDVEDLTGYPKMLDGRVKSLHPAIHGGILAIRKNRVHMRELKKYKITPLDMVVCNLYPFEKVISRKKFKHEEAVENIDIGGPTMVRAASKNYQDVAIVTNPEKYGAILEELKERNGEFSFETKERLATEAFEHTARYDALIYGYFYKRISGAKGIFPHVLNVSLEKIQDLRYGENPHQQAAFYREVGKRGIGNAKQLHGKELSFNNILDIEAAWRLANYYVDPTVIFIKHTNPCGAGTGKTISEAYKKAYAGDPLSAFGGIIGSNRPITHEIAKEIKKIFVEAVIAPGYDREALKLLKTKKNLRILQLKKEKAKGKSEMDFRRVSGGFLLQQDDVAQLSISDIKVVTKKQPTIGQLEELFFAWGVCKHVKSNAIVITRGGRVLGVGAGQMSRIDSTDIAIRKSLSSTAGAVLASDAFFPFPDSVNKAAKAGIKAIIQPGGSIRDQEVIKACDKHKIAMVFTGRRHFRH